MSGKIHIIIDVREITLKDLDFICVRWDRDSEVWGSIRGVTSWLLASQENSPPSGYMVGTRVTSRQKRRKKTSRYENFVLQIHGNK